MIKIYIINEKCGGAERNDNVVRWAIVGTRGEVRWEREKPTVIVFGAGDNGSGPSKYLRINVGVLADQR